MRWLALAFLLLSASVVAQDARPHFHSSFGVAGGNYHFDSDLSGFDGGVGAGLLQARVEYTTTQHVGGGIRFEHLDTDRGEGLFRDPTNIFDRGTQARSSTLLIHGTFRVEQHRFTMPIRVGLLINGFVLDEQTVANPETTYLSVGPFFEVEPELVLLRRGKLEWSIYGQFGFGVGGTSIEVDGSFRDYESATGFGMVEAGTRLRIGRTQVGIAFIGRYQSMDRSELEGNSCILGYDSAFEGVLFTAGFCF